MLKLLPMRGICASSKNFRSILGAAHRPAMSHARPWLSIANQAWTPFQAPAAALFRNRLTFMESALDYQRAGKLKTPGQFMEKDSSSTHAATQAEEAGWRRIVVEYQQPSRWRAWWQIINTLAPFAAIWCLMYLSRSISWWLVLPLAVLAGMFLVRVFIIFHDCGHGSYFKSRKANDALGFITGVLTFTPFYQWRWDHAIHHATSGHLDKRGTGDLWTLTVEEYLASSRGRRFAYRLARNPFVLFVLAPLFVLVFKQRLPSANANRRERRSVYWMNLALLGMTTGGCLVFGVLPYLVIQLIVISVAGSAGFWFFYVQHQFEGVYWERTEQWNYSAAALEGSSFYKLPKVLQWFSGNIGYHHIHHLSPRIPNYNLERCHKAHLMFQQVKPLTLFASLKSLSLRLWDERRKKLVGFRHLRKLRKREAKSFHS
jgi:omega-6 fatty acid desaturase (delta-12 desaturase)